MGVVFDEWMHRYMGVLTSVHIENRISIVECMYWKTNQLKDEQAPMWEAPNYLYQSGHKSGRKLHSCALAIALRVLKHIFQAMPEHPDRAGVCYRFEAHALCPALATTVSYDLLAKPAPVPRSTKKS